MDYIVSSSSEINYNPKNAIEDVIRNVHMILRVYQSEQPLLRNFAMDPNIIDKKISVVENRILQDIIPLLKNYEPRAKVKRLELKMNTIADFEIHVEIEVIIL